MFLLLAEKNHRDQILLLFILVGTFVLNYFLFVLLLFCHTVILTMRTSVFLPGETLKSAAPLVRDGHLRSTAHVSEMPKGATTVGLQPIPVAARSTQSITGNEILKQRPWPWHFIALRQPSFDAHSHIINPAHYQHIVRNSFVRVDI